MSLLPVIRDLPEIYVHLILFLLLFHRLRQKNNTKHRRTSQLLYAFIQGVTEKELTNGMTLVLINF